MALWCCRFGCWCNDVDAIVENDVEVGEENEEYPCDGFCEACEDCEEVE